ncbi:hypothetical protein P872_11330 [Rhodonellum psychrophilum GCM71 = DSM 17998]|uniref:T9SS C-terminal target domain-containing protein n=2 Tax=Rhodonellum TaxID=336827 RepID=U5BSE2_9BACT|nr:MULTISPECIES: hypothetical protein [Rhodonellum]ERM80818.1 hypothetical protein P872_11330 [Rhodonellum psychrophilum GCM71 = DSM 17998]MDO9552564.1 hypothetical protein [Rhodonellum sp.]SDY45988.1 hypothetical protein SAMN05444412_101219 [Rhodonellum ikkaensis]
MKKTLKFAAFAALLAFSFSCGEDNPTPVTPEPEETLVELIGDLSTRTLTADKQYLLKGQVFIQTGQTVTIQPGTVIYGEKRSKGTLIVNRGGKLIARGTKALPIIMTSAQAPGERDRSDWGGLVILGRAKTNQANPAVEGIDPVANFGGEDDADSSGEYEFLRVEYAGIELTPNNETNSITMGGVGRGTFMEHLMVSFGGDDGFEWFGGTVNGRYLISHSTWDDDFDVDYGYSGNVQFGLAVRNPFYADQSQSNGFETDNGPNDNDVQPYTTGTFSNITIYGPRDRVGRSISGNNFHGMDMRRRTAVSIANSVIAGFPVGLRFNTASVTQQYQSGTGVLTNNILINPNTDYAAGGGADVANVKAYWESKNTSVSLPAADGPWEAFYRGYGLNPDNFFAKYTVANYPNNPNFSLVANGTLLTGASFEDAKFSEATRTAFFDKNVPFVGAFGTTDWTDGWAEFSPLNIVYAK